MKKRIITALILSLTCSAFAGITFQQDQQGYQAEKFLSVNPVFGFKNGTLGEYVFLTDPAKASDTGKVTDDKLSYLEWQIKNEFYAGLNIDASFKKIYVGASLNLGFPGKSGKVFDSDWLNIQKEDGNGIITATKEQQSWKTSFSKHDNQLDYDFFTHIKAGYTFEPLSFFKIVPSAGLSYSRIKFTAKDGPYWYGEFKDTCYEKYTTATKSVTGNGIALEYQREQTAMLLGVNFLFNTPFKTVFNLGINSYPFVYTFNRDNHHGTNVTYVDICSDFFPMWNFSLDVSYQVTTHISVNLWGSYTMLNPIRGNAYENQLNGNSYTRQTGVKGGADSNSFEISLGAKYCLW